MKKFTCLMTALAWLSHAPMVMADDIDILGASLLSVEPNVMIIFDTSGSMMTNDIPEDPYDGDTDYTAGGGGYEKDAVYAWRHDPEGGSWSKLVQRNLLDRSCTDTHLDNALDGDGLTWGRINTRPPYNCGEVYNEIELRIGNFLNYENGGYAGHLRRRLDVAKTVVKQFIENHPGVRFGLMRFAPADDRQRGDSGGGVLSEHGDINTSPTAAQLAADIDSFLAESDSPLAETLAEAGLYFAGQSSWYHNRTYTSPIDIKCRPNAIILMTDGDSTRDQDARLSLQNAYIHGGTIGDYDGDGHDPGAYDLGGTDYLDDVAMFLYDNDLMPDLGIGDSRYEKQNITTHVIGFKKTHRLLQDTAVNGGGAYFTAGSATALKRGFEKILHTIERSRMTFSTPTVPVSRSNGAYAGDFLYLGLFQPGLPGDPWRGNLKKYKLNAFGELMDMNNRPATASDGTILPTAQSFWSAMADGMKVDMGGAGALMVNRPSRNLYTYVGDDDKDLTADINAFALSNNDHIELDDLGVEDEDEWRAVINQVHGEGKEWVMADVLHSEPTVVHYNTNGDNEIDHHDDALVYVGTNGGVMHAFLDSSGEELWGFIPPGQLGRLKRLTEDHSAHGYAVDGPPVAFSSGKNGEALQRTLVFGERRGGSNYYALDITVHDRPQWKYRIRGEILGENAEQLGQSWGRPQIATIATGPESTVEVLLLPGGYDPRQDEDITMGNDERGRAVFSVHADSGALGPFQFSNDDNHPDMTHSIVDLVGVDSDGDGIISCIYAPDLGGNMFAFSDHDIDGVWKKTRIFNASSDTQRKIFYSPDVIRIIGDPDPSDHDEEEKVGEMIFFGTGDRAHPRKIKSSNRFYAVKNYDWDPDFETMTDKIDANGNGDLNDATDNTILQGPTLEAQQRAMVEINQRMGWFINLEAAGEKVVSSPVVYNHTVYFTTYVPAVAVGASTDADCDPHDQGGEARLYGLSCKDGRAMHDEWSEIKEYNPVTQKEIKSGGKADRYIRIGTSMPSAPKMVIRDGLAKLYVGVDGRLLAIGPKKAVEMNMYYWRELYGGLKEKPNRSQK